MKAQLRLLFRLGSIVVLFIAGVVIAAGLFPIITFTCSKQYAKHLRDAIKMYWLQWFSTLLNLRITRQGELPEPGALLVCNHISWLDIIVVGRYLPGYFVAKSDILSWPVIGFLAKQAGTIFIRRGDKKHIHATTEQMVWLLKQHSNIVVFPEGTTTVGEDVLHFHASLFQPAMLTRAVIQPVALSYQGQAQLHAPFVGDDEFVPHLLKMLSLETIEVAVNFLPTLNSAGKTRVAISDEARTMIRADIVADASDFEEQTCQPVRRV